MRLLSTFVLVCVLGMFSPLQAQTAKDATVPITATLNASPVGITLNWVNPGNANLLILRRTKGQAGNAWQQVINLTGSNVNSLIDNGVANGQTYEYVIQRTVNTINAFGYAHVAVNANAINTRGKILIFVDSTTADAAGVELVQLKNDMRGDGWWPVPFKTGPSSTVQSVKDQIVAAYNADQTNVKAVLLIGNVPIPYSGNAAWDGHVPDHEGAWPADSYYGDMNGVWTDATVNNVVPNRDANDNIPGDGKFDQNFMPSAAELQVGRIDFRRLDPAAFGAADHVALLKRYLAKNHRWRTGEYVVDGKAIVDDNFGYFGGEAFAANGFRNAYPLVGEANIVEADFFADTNPQSYLMGFGCGGGNYNGAGGVGSSADFATDSINIVFSNLFGSYFGDWDFESNPFMPSALASRGGILNCSWAGRPHHFYQALASGETIGYVMQETMNAQFNNGFFGSFGESGAHVALLGDPTIRANVVKPAKNLVVTAPTCNSVVLNWTASADVVTGYHVYRALSQDGPYTRLTISPTTATTFTDNNPVLDTLYYQVRAIKNVTHPGGGTYANNATGPITQFVFTAAGGPTVTATGGALTCANLSLNLSADAGASVITNWNWSGPGNFNSTLQNPSVSSPGTYTVTATDASGCKASATATVMGDFTAPTITVTVSNAIDCANASAVITVSPAGLASSTISGPNGFFVQGFEATATQAGTYSISGVSATNGCIGTAPAVVNLNVTIPSISASNNGPITCSSPSVELLASSNAPNAVFAWGGPCATGNTATCVGVYTVTVTNPANGCTNTAGTIVDQDLVIPDVAAQGGTLTCAVLSVPLTAVSNLPNAAFAWTGPCVSGGPQFVATCPGTYTVVATHPFNGCTNSASVDILSDVTPPLANAGADALLSCGSPVAELNGSGSSSGNNFAYQWVGNGFSSNNQNTTTNTAGTYTLLVTNTQNGCTASDEMQVAADPNLPVVNATASGQLDCNTLSVALQSGNNDVGATYNWSPAAGLSCTNCPNPLASLPGTYTVVVSVGACSASDEITVTEVPELTGAFAPSTVNCDGVVSICLNVSGGTAPYVYEWSNASSAAGSCATYTTPSTVAVTVLDANQCSFEATLDLPFQAPLGVSINATISCTAPPTLCATATGGVAAYTYLWSNGATSACISPTAAGTFSLTVTDAAGCTRSGSLTVVQPPVIQGSVLITNESGSNANDGAVDLTVVGGNGPFSYLWSNGAITQDIVGLAGGTYTVTVTDVSTGCTSTVTAVVNTSVGTEEAAYFVQFQLSPNPTEGLALLSVQLYQSMDVRVEVRDVAGRLVWENPCMHTETLSLPIDMSQSPAGMYSVSVRVGNQVFVRKLAVVR